MERVILHCDMNNFYASVECRDHPELAGRCVAVCGSREERHGIVLAKNQRAKEMGVCTGETIWSAQRKCPQLTIVPPHFDRYLEVSSQARALYGKYTDQVEPFGMDECWLDVTGSQRLFGTGLEMAHRIRREVRERLGVTISVGVSFNKSFAKLGSDLKKPDAVTAIDRESFREQVWPLPASALLGVGRHTYPKLQRYGIQTIGDLANAQVSFLQGLLGVNGGTLWLYANGLDDSPVLWGDLQTPMKSISHGITTSADLRETAAVGRVFLSLSQEVSRRLIQAGLAATRVQIGVKDNRLRTVQFQRPLECLTQNSFDLAETAIQLFERHYGWKAPVRALTLRALDLVTDRTPQQMTLLSDVSLHNRRERMESEIYRLRNRYGKGAVTVASLLLDTKRPLPYGAVMPSAFLRKLEEQRLELSPSCLAQPGEGPLDRGDSRV